MINCVYLTQGGLGYLEVRKKKIIYSKVYDNHFEMKENMKQGLQLSSFFFQVFSSATEPPLDIGNEVRERTRRRRLMSG